MNGLISLKSIVDDLLLQTKDGESNYITYLRLAERCVTEELNPFTTGSAKAVKYTIDKTILNVPLPKDYVSLVRLGVIVNGSIVPIYENTHLRIQRPVNCSEVESEVDMVDMNMPNEYNNGTNYFGRYRINKQNRVIEFSSDITFNECIMEYYSTGIKANGETLVEIDVRPVIIAYINWKEAEYDKSLYQNYRMELKLNFEYEHTKLRQKQTKPLDEIIGAVYTTNLTK